MDLEGAVVLKSCQDLDVNNVSLFIYHMIIFVFLLMSCERYTIETILL